MKNYVRLCKRSGNYDLINNILNDENLTTNIYLVASKYNVPINEIESILELKKSEYSLGCGFENGPKYFFDLYNHIMDGGKGGKGGKGSRGKGNKGARGRTRNREQRNRSNQSSSTRNRSKQSASPRNRSKQSSSQRNRSDQSSSPRNRSKQSTSSPNRSSRSKSPDVTMKAIANKFKNSNFGREITNIANVSLNNFKKTAHQEFNAINTFIQDLSDELTDTRDELTNARKEIKAVHKKLKELSDPDNQEGGKKKSKKDNKKCKCVCVDQYDEFISTNSDSSEQMEKCGGS